MQWGCFTSDILCVEYVSKIVFNAIYGGCVYSAYPVFLWWLREYMYFILLSSSNHKNDPFANV